MKNKWCIKVKNIKKNNFGQLEKLYKTENLSIVADFFEDNNGNR